MKDKCARFSFIHTHALDPSMRIMSTQCKNGDKKTIIDKPRIKNEKGQEKDKEKGRYLFAVKALKGHDTLLFPFNVPNLFGQLP